MEIIQVMFDSMESERNQLIQYAKSCSWQSTGQYLAELLENHEFDASEKIFAAIENQDIVGFAGLVKESCADDLKLYPWLDFLFVDERYRNRGIARRLIEHIFKAAKAENVSHIYLCTVSHTEMYMRFGFHTLYKTKINANDDCFVMGIEL